MLRTPPAWIQLLRPVTDPVRAPISPSSVVLVWHVDIQMEAWLPPPDAVLSGSDNWNGKALVVGTNSGLARSVGEVEIAARLRDVVWAAAWTGKPGAAWSRWALDPLVRSTWLKTVDDQIRGETPLLQGNKRGIPDVLRWKAGQSDFCCVEYKGPSPTKPTRPDTIKPEQVAWVQKAVELGLLEEDRIAVVSWRPDAASSAALLSQAAASKRGRDARRSGQSV